MLVNMGLWYDTDDLDQKAYHYFRKAMDIYEKSRKPKYRVLAGKIMKNYLNGDVAEVEFYKVHKL